ncbi:Hydantoinase/oxoprolinase [Anatilimnocola aggregata]|uniref:Hydantoinase/oxoprolinase n=1 Tax=Anatilimnocola aggregata TaxID=2528021 RepID=A0A517YDW4_9BACT|nr:hydantoinase/oxoprolinase family protein [Anatilimnocola aggregata]QDU28444.1 Hydantoinase/oxoprolinase [Anatilimnocola aggregata]
MSAKYLALDIGGANIKVANGQKYAESYSFALWRDPNALTQQVRTIISEAPPSDHLVVTMTGELADCFTSKAEGVKFILKSVAAGSDNRHTRVYRVDGKMVSTQVAYADPLLVAAANWHALASYAARFAGKNPALLIDVGSTTVDVIPLRNGLPAATGKTDTERLRSGELVYTGVERSPACAVACTVKYRGESCPLVQEVFATMRDAYIVLEKLPEDSLAVDTADHRPATKANSRLRLARMIAADHENFNHKDAVVMANNLAEAQTAHLREAIERVIKKMPEPPVKIILSGHGEFLAAAALEGTPYATFARTLLHKEIGADNSRCAPAYALAVLSREAAQQ